MFKIPHKELFINTKQPRISPRLLHFHFTYLNFSIASSMLMPPAIASLRLAFTS